MKTSTFAFLAAQLSLFTGYAAAACQLENITPDVKIPTDDPFCLPQGEGAYTFTMEVSAVSVPTFNGGNALAGYASNVQYAIYDNSCKLLAAFGEPDDNDCGIPYVIQDPSIKYTLTITEINKDVGAPRYSFDYANGKYSINNNGCKCFDVSHDLEAGQACRCAFPVDGEPV